MKRNVLFVCLAMLAVIASGRLLAHHGGAAFDHTSSITLQGTMTELHRCGDTIALIDPYIGGNQDHVSILTLDLRYVRRVRMGSPLGPVRAAVRDA